MANVLVVSPTPFEPANAGNRERIKGLVSMLRQLQHCVHFVHVSRERGDANRMRDLLGDRFHVLEYNVVKPKHTRARRWLRKLNVQAGFRTPIDEWYDPGIEAPIRSIIETELIDIVFVEYAYMSRLLEVLPNNVLKVLDTHDVFADRHARFQVHGIDPAWLSCSVEDETMALNRADIVIAIQDREADYFRKHVQAEVVSVGHLVTWAMPSDNERTIDLLYLGSNNPINQASLNWFLEEVMPTVHAQTGAKVVVAGSVSEDLQASKLIVPLGKVADLRSLYHSVAVVVNPARLGTGLKIKTIEALGHGCAVITTPIGAEGLESGAGDAFIVADDAQTFSHHLVRLLSDPSEQEKLRKQTNEFVQRYNQHCWNNLEYVLGKAESKRSEVA